MAHDPETCPYLSEVHELQLKHEERCRLTDHAFDAQTPEEVEVGIERCSWCDATRHTRAPQPKEEA